MRMRNLTLLAALALAPGVGAQEGEPGYLGVSVAAIDKAGDKGVLLTLVEPGSAAEKAGLRVGDIVVFFDGKAIASMDDLVERVRARRAGDRVTYKVLRGTGSIEGTLRLRARPPDATEPETPAPREKAAGPVMPGDLDGRLDRVAKQIEALRRRIEGREPREKRAPVPRGLAGWIAREQGYAAAARKRGDVEAVRYHEIRLSVLDEMRRVGARLPAPDRMERIEKKLDAILELLRAQK